MRLSAFVRNATFALVLLLLVAAVDGAGTAVARNVRDYIVFVLTHDFDYRPWVESVRARLAWPPAFWPGGRDVGSEAAVPVPELSGDGR